MATVSRVLNDPSRVSPRSRKRVHASIEALEYIPDSSARALSAGRTHCIGAVIPTLEHSIYATFVEAMQTRIMREGYSLVVASSGFEPARELFLVKSLASHGVDAFVLSGATHGREIYSFLEERNLPYVHTSVYLPESPHPCVGYDNRRAAYEVTQHLHTLGHRVIAALVGTRANNDRMVMRVDGIRGALAEFDLKLPESRICECVYQIGRAREAFRQLLARGDQFTAVICGNDILAFGVMLEAAAKGIHIPGDISVVGFDDLELASQITPGLTTVATPSEKMGTATAEHLLARLTGSQYSLHTEIPLRLILRGSTAPPPG